MKIKLFETIERITTFDEPQRQRAAWTTYKPKPKAREKPDEEFRRWARQVGFERATAAREVQRNQTRGRLHGRATLIELLTEAFLQRRGVSYEAQVEMGIARPDFVVIVRGEATIWNVNGERWHAPRTWHDYGKGSALINFRVQDCPIVDVIDLWESDILRSDQVLEDALRGERYRN